jgi:hypothetical protein
MIRKIVAFIVVFLSIPIIGWAATYYVDASVANDSGSGSPSSPKKYIPSGIALMSGGGNTLIIKSGSYSGSLNNITSLNPGTSGAYNIIKAETDGGVVISANFSISSGSYVQIEGLKFTIAATKSCDGTYIKFKRCAFQGGSTCSSGCDGEVVFAAGSYQLYEDCWFYGVGGRYTLAIYEGHDVVFRRCVVRRDGGYTFDGSNPEAPVVNYGSYNVSYQNVIAIDNNIMYSTGYAASFYATGHTSNPSSNNVSFIGCIDLNGKSGSYYIDTDDGSTGMFLTDFIMYDNVSGISDGNTGTKLTLDGITLGKLTQSAINVWHGSASLINSIIYNHTSTGVGSPLVMYINSYNPSSYSGTGVTHLNPISNGLLYLPRIETGSVLKTSGSSGRQIGASVIYKIGTDGTLFGEAGYNTVTTNNLWPWPYEDRIKVDLSTVSNRGFCADSQTLTNYVWGYLGNILPPFNVVVSPGNQQTVLTWDANTYDSGVKGYKIYKGTSSGSYTFDQTVTSTAATIIGLANNTTNYFVITTNSDRGESGYSYEVSAIPHLGPSAPTVMGTTPTNDTTPTWSWSSGGGGDGIYRYNLGSDPSGDGDTSTAFQPSSSLSDGTYTLYVQERDAAGNWSNSGSSSIVIDTTVDITNGSVRGGDGGGCFIATAAYGSALEPHVEILREFRDAYLMPTKLGRGFVKLYYEYSPALADVIKKHDSMRAMVRWGLTPVVGASYLALHAGRMQKIMFLVLSLALGVYVLLRSRLKEKG